MVGYIFLSSDATTGECLKRGLFGGGEKYSNRVKDLKKGDKLFTYNFNAKELHGVFEAITPVRKNIVPTAWKGIYPMQVRVKRVNECKPLSREDLKDLLKFNAFGQPSARLDADVLAKLEKKFKAKKRIRTYDDSTRYVTNDGHKVRSKAEEQIDNWLYAHRIAHGYEAPIPDAKRSDFEVPTTSGTVYIEYWGLDSESYLRNKKLKEAIYKKHHLTLVNIYPKDLKNLNKILAHLTIS